MKRLMLKSKINGATITGLELEYEGSITMAEDLLEVADILPGEQVHVLNLNNGARFITYAIRGERGSSTVLLNGPAARLGHPGDRVIVLAYCQVEDAECGDLTPTVIKVDADNQPIAD